MLTSGKVEGCVIKKHQPVDEFSGVAQLLNPEEDWKHRNFSAATLSGLKSVCRDYVAGKPLVCVFIGESGSGKTIAATMIARETELSLYRVDLEAVMQKYVEETEKCLQQLFDRAEATNAILFFEEADDLFAGRTRLSSTSDDLLSRYSSILGMINKYPGIVILATSTRPDYSWLMQRKYRYIIDFYKKSVSIPGT